MAGRLTYWIAHRGETVAPDGSVTLEKPACFEEEEQGQTRHQKTPIRFSETSRKFL